MRLLLLTPPMIQLNTPYPATAYLTGFLRQHASGLGLDVTQADTSLSLFLRLYSAPLLRRMAEELRARVRAAGKRTPVPPSIAHFLEHEDRYVDTVEPAIIPVVLGATLLLSSFGPWGAIGVSRRSQQDRLIEGLPDSLEAIGGHRRSGNLDAAQADRRRCVIRDRDIQRHWSGRASSEKDGVGCIDDDRRSSHRRGAIGHGCASRKKRGSEKDGQCAHVCLLIGLGCKSHAGA